MLINKLLYVARRQTYRFGVCSSVTFPCLSLFFGSFPWQVGRTSSLLLHVLWSVFSLIMAEDWAGVNHLATLQAPPFLSLWSWVPGNTCATSCMTGFVCDKRATTVALPALVEMVLHFVFHPPVATGALVFAGGDGGPFLFSFSSGLFICFVSRLVAELGRVVRFSLSIN